MYVWMFNIYVSDLAAKLHKFKSPRDTFQAFRGHWCNIRFMWYQKHERVHIIFLKLLLPIFLKQYAHKIFECWSLSVKNAAKKLIFKVCKIYTTWKNIHSRHVFQIVYIIIFLNFINITTLVLNLQSTI